MKYSCFDDKTGTYTYFEDSSKLAINMDLPIPKFGPSVGGIGVSAIEAGRSLPIEARRVGSGWFPQGTIVNCNKPQSIGNVFSDTGNWIQDGGWKWLVAGAAGIVIWRNL